MPKKRRRKAPITTEQITTRGALKGRHLINEFHRSLESSDRTLDDLGQYQATSLRAQRNRHKGGDTSKVLVEWLRELNYHKADRPVSLLDVGCLDPLGNHYARKGNDKWIKAVGIDIRRASPGVLQQDFMERPMPSAIKDKFDIISLSLVLNFVPTPKARGDMLKRTIAHLRNDPNLPSLLFIVLPTPCIAHSMHTDSDHLCKLLNACGYELQPVRSRHSNSGKLSYYLFRLASAPQPIKAVPLTTLPSPSAPDTRNTFAIIIQRD